MISFETLALLINIAIVVFVGTGGIKRRSQPGGRALLRWRELMPG